MYASIDARIVHHYNCVVGNKPPPDFERFLVVEYDAEVHMNWVTCLRLTLDKLEQSVSIAVWLKEENCYCMFRRQRHLIFQTDNKNCQSENANDWSFIIVAIVATYLSLTTKNLSRFTLNYMEVVTRLFT